MLSPRLLLPKAATSGICQVLHGQIQVHTYFSLLWNSATPSDAINDSEVPEKQHYIRWHFFQMHYCMPVFNWLYNKRLQDFNARLPSEFNCHIHVGIIYNDHHSSLFMRTCPMRMRDTVAFRGSCYKIAIQSGGGEDCIILPPPHTRRQLARATTNTVRNTYLLYYRWVLWLFGRLSFHSSFWIRAHSSSCNHTHKHTWTMANPSISILLYHQQYQLM